MTRIFHGLLVCALTLSVAGCASVDRPSKKPQFPNSYKQRHPIVVRNAPVTLDIYVTGSQIDRRSVEDIITFSGDYKIHGKGLITIAVPKGSQEDGLAQRSLKGIQLVLKKSGIPANRTRIMAYNASNAMASPPIKMSFYKLKAEVDSRCGMYPDDITGTSDGKGKENREYWNFGCSYQNMLAEQTDDPRDFFGGRRETAPDTTLRLQQFKRYRSGANLN